MKQGRKPMHPLPGTTARCAHCDTVFTLSTGQRSDLRRGRGERQCCSGACQRGMNGAKNGTASAAKISAARLKLFAESTYYRKVNGVHEHRTVAAAKLGRALRPGEIVHHLDENKRNNHPGNLQVMTQAEHARLHLTGKSK